MVFFIFVECLHKVLEEIELLLKVWKKRVNHPFTAHLERKVAEEDLSEEPDSGFGVRLRIVLKITAESDESDERIFFLFFSLVYELARITTKVTWNQTLQISDIHSDRKPTSI